MWSFDRRTVILGALALGGCGFAPVHGQGGAGERLAGQVAVSAPATADGFHFTARVEDRLGRAAAPAYTLNVQLSEGRRALGNTSLGDTTRFRLIGTATYQVTDASGGQVSAGRTEAFTGYNTIGSIVATLAAERDARERLMVLLADQVLDAMVLDLTSEAT